MFLGHQSFVMSQLVRQFSIDDLPSIDRPIPVELTIVVKGTYTSRYFCSQGLSGSSSFHTSILALYDIVPRSIRSPLLVHFPTLSLKLTHTITHTFISLWKIVLISISQIGYRKMTLAYRLRAISIARHYIARCRLCKNCSLFLNPFHVSLSEKLFTDRRKELIQNSNQCKKKCRTKVAARFQEIRRPRESSRVSINR